MFQDVVLIVIGIGALFSLIFHLGVNEVKETENYYHTHSINTVRPPAMKATDWLKEKQFYQVKLFF